MKTILITAIGGDIAQGVASIIREARPEYRLIGTDMHTQHGGTLFVDNFHLVPAASNPVYTGAVAAIVKREKVDAFLPLSEVELGVWLESSGILGDVDWIFPGKTVVHAGLDKLETAMQLQALALPAPWTMSASDGQPKSCPCIFKGRYGSGSRNIFLVRDQTDAEYLHRRYPESVYQELLEPEEQEITCAVFRSAEGKVATFQMLRKLTGGLTGWVETIENEEVSAMCERVAVGLELRGSMNIQMRITDVGPRIFEINPRFSSTALIRHRLGFSDVLWSLDDLEGRSIVFPRLQAGRIAVRTQGAALLNNGGVSCRK